MVCLIVIPTASAAPRAIRANMPIHIEVETPNNIKKIHKEELRTKLLLPTFYLCVYITRRLPTIDPIALNAVNIATASLLLEYSCFGKDRKSSL